MCGILGFCSRQDVRAKVNTLDGCRDALRLRGPDMAGHLVYPQVYLGFRRLAILDLSTEANQPMTSVDGRYSLVFNGEIYNFVELRKELEQQGHRFRTQSDTEVLLQLCERFGVERLNQLNGMFAFAFYDRLERTLLLVRDRLGVKPLFGWKQAGTFAFASEVCALRGLPGFPSEIDPQALALYLRSGAVPEWTSIYPGLFKVPPGCWLRYHLESEKLEGPVPYWDLPAPAQEDDPRPEADWIDEIQAVLWDATRIRLRSDVPLGVFLSGGIDSGLVAAAAVEHLPRLTSLTIGFAGQPVDETHLALATARHLGLSAITRNIDMTEGMQLLPQVMAHFDEPFADTSALPTSLVCAAARKDFTVVLSGDAGDEVFGGYRHHVQAWRWRWLDRIPLSCRQWLGTSLAKLLPPDSQPKRFSRRLAYPVGRFGVGSALYPFHDWLERCIRPELILSPQSLIQLYEEHLPAARAGSGIDLAQRTDLRHYLLADILVKVDRMSMKHSLEVRSPFLDYRLVELGLRLPARLRVKNGRNKYLLRKLAERHLPKAVCLAPKHGFEIPMREWLREPTNRLGLKQALQQRHSGWVDPLVKDGAERLWSMAERNSSLTIALVLVLSYRWWCQARPENGAAAALAV